MAEESSPNAASASSHPQTSSAPPAEEGRDVTSPAADQTTTEVPEEASAAADNTTLEDATEKPAGGEDGDDTMEAGAGIDGAAVANNVTDANRKKEKRKSSAGVPEHKVKKLNRKKSTMTLHLDVQPGQLWWARLKGYPPWPSVICDEDMLPQVLLDTRPVSAARQDGSYRADYADGGKNVKDRTYPVMYLHTNEFGWMVNTDLIPLEMDEVNAAGPEKKSKDLWKAYEVAKTEPDLAYFKKVLKEHDDAVKADLAGREERDAKKAKKDAKAKRKSTAGAGDDVDMEDAEDEDAEEENGKKKTKASKKRKKGVDSEGEESKPAKTPKTKLKMTGPKTPKTPNGESAAKAKAKPKAKKAKDTPKAEEKPMTEEERLEKKRQNVMFLRHKLQKGFLTRDKEPQSDEMAEMADMFTKLEAYIDLEVSIIQATKINKVLRGILKLPFIPNDDEYNIKKRSTDILAVWNKALASEVEDTSDKKTPAANGVSKEDKGEEMAKDVAETKKVLESAKKDVSNAATSKEDAAKDIEEKVDDELPGHKVEDEADVALPDAEKMTTEENARKEEGVENADATEQSAAADAIEESSAA